MAKTAEEALQKFLSKSTGTLPSLPKIATEVIALSRDSEATLGALVKLIEQDAGIASRILRVSNSALYGFPSAVQSLAHAVTLLGSQTVRNLALAMSMKGTYKRFGLMEKLLWEHSALAGPITVAVSTFAGSSLNSDDAFTAGLIHDIGKTALANSHREKYEKVIARVYNESISFVVAETEFFGFDHSLLGAEVAKRWGLPTVLSDIIRYHHRIDELETMSEEFGQFVAIVGLSTAVLTKLGVGRREPAVDLDLTSHPAWLYLELEKTREPDLLELCAGRLEEAKSLVE